MQNRRNNLPLYIALVGLVAVILANWRVASRRQVEDKLNRDLVNQKMPPTLALTTQAVGPFRGLISNGLWWRAVRLQDEGNHFEAIQLADWISSLQPKQRNVWTWQAWNMAYNIAAEYEDPEEKWKWVMEGMSLLRDKGLRYNPRDAMISLDICRLFMEKIGKDRGNRLRWAKIMARHLPNGSRSDIEALLEIPDSERALRENSAVSVLIDRAAALGLNVMNPDNHFLTVSELEALPKAQQAILTAEENKTSLATIRQYLARKGLEQDLKMDLEHMLLIDEKYGGFDWRLHHAHAVYWGAEDSYEAEKLREDYQFPYHRMAMMDSFYDGQLLYMDDRGLTTGPNLQIAAQVHRYVHKHAVHYEHDESAKKSIREFHEWAVLILYSQMYTEQAREMFEDLRDNVMEESERKRWTFESFVANHAGMLVTKGATEEQQAVIYTSLSQAFYWMGMGDAYKAKGYENMARTVWRQNRKQYAKNPKRLAPPFEDMKRTVFSQAISRHSGLPEYIKARLRAMGTGRKITIQQPIDSRPEVDLGEDAHDDH